MSIRKQVAAVAIAGLVASAAPIAPAEAHSYHVWTPWPAVAVMVGAAGVMTNAAWIWHTQCRELSSREAMTSTVLPIIGMAFDSQASKCR